MITRQTTPLGRVIDFDPNGLGQATGARLGTAIRAETIVYDASGRVQSFDYGNGLTLTDTYNARQLLVERRVSDGVNKPVQLNHTHDANGRILTITDNVVAGQNRTYGYDGVGRLVSATGPWGIGGAAASGSFDYDSLGNLRRKTLGARVVDIDYDSLNRVDRARDTADGSIWRDYTHDDRGNVIDNDRIVFTYDRAEQPTAISGLATGTFEYDGNYRRVKQTINGEEIYSVYGLSGALLYRENTTANEKTDYVRVAGTTVARIKAGVTSYLHADHLGSPVAATTTGGAVQWREDYTPFGEERQDPAANDNDENFTGHIRDEATGLIYAQQRYMDPVIGGRFLSPDPVQFSVEAPQMFNRYSYALNDPVNKFDPFGMAAWTPGFDLWAYWSNGNNAVGGLVSVQAVINIPFFDGSKFDVGLSVTTGTANSDLGPGVGVGLPGLDVLSGSVGPVQNLEGAGRQQMIGLGLTLDAVESPPGELVGGAIGVGLEGGVGSFDTNTTVFSFGDLARQTSNPAQDNEPAMPNSISVNSSTNSTNSSNVSPRATGTFRVTGRIESNNLSKCGDVKC